jgi:hypothetical protein
MRCTTILAFLVAACSTTVSSAFVIKAPAAAARESLVRLEAHRNRVIDIATTAAVAFSVSPLAALAEEVDDYEYGAVNAPIGLAWGVGLLAILTAFLPVFLKGGEEAFEEMKDRDSDKWGSGNTDALKGKKKR